MTDSEDEKSDFYDEIELEDMFYDEDEEFYYYPCPCGDNFIFKKDDIIDGEEIAYCPSCPLKIKVIY